MKNKLLVLLSSLVLSCGALTGCFNHNNDDTKVNYTSIDQLGEFDTSKNVEITFYHTMGQPLQNKLNQALTRFNELYPNITVSHIAIGGYDDVRDQLSKEISVGSQANLSYCYSDHVATYLKSNKVLNMDIMINDTKYGYGLTSAQQSNFIDSYYNEGKSFGDGHMYMLPFSKSTEVLYYDKTFFTQNSLSVPTTWDEMETVCRQIKLLKPLDTPLGYDSSSNLFITMAEQLGSGYTSVDKNNSYNSNFIFNNATNKQFVNRIRTWYKDGLIETKDTYNAYTSGLFTNTDTKTARCYMCIGSSAGASYQTPEGAEFEVDIAPIPQANANNKKVISQGPSVCIFQDSNPQKVIASWLLLKFLTTDEEFQIEFSCESGYVPVLKSVFEHPVYQEFLDEADGYSHIQAKSCKVCTAQAANYFTSPAFNGSANARDVVGKLLTSCITAKDAEYNIDNLFAEAIANCEYAQI